MNDAITPPALVIFCHHPFGGWQILGPAAEDPGVDRAALQAALGDLLEATLYEVGAVVWICDGCTLHGLLSWRLGGCRLPQDRKDHALEIVERIAKMLDSALGKQWEAADQASREGA